MTRPAKMRVAVLATVWFEGCHTDVIVPPIVEGWTLDGVEQQTELDVVSMYLEQVGCVQGDDLGLPFLERHGIRRALSIGEALVDGTGELAVDGVIIIGEHGDYELNEYGQQVYPRRRFFDAAIAAMTAAGQYVPIFNDKGLAYSARDANEMAATARRLGVGYGAGSTIPLSWRVPVGAEWPQGAAMDAAVLLGWGPLERYGFHCLEGLQAHVERRAGGETGVAQVVALDREASHAAIAEGRVDSDLLAAAFDSLELTPAQREQAILTVAGVIEVHYADGLVAHVVICEDEVRQFAFAARGGSASFVCQMWLPGAPHLHFTFLVRQAEQLIRDGRPQIPIERTQLTTGILDAAMRSGWSGEAMDTPELAISYSAPERVEGTGVALPRPAGWTPLG
ncbi:hypothetical protein ACYX8G_08095 [Microbacterium saperdae]